MRHIARFVMFLFTLATIMSSVACSNPSRRDADRYIQGENPNGTILGGVLSDEKISLDGDAYAVCQKNGSVRVVKVNIGGWTSSILGVQNSDIDQSQAACGDKLHQLQSDAAELAEVKKILGDRTSTSDSVLQRIRESAKF